jgi:hypothetical protein
VGTDVLPGTGAKRSLLPPGETRVDRHLCHPKSQRNPPQKCAIHQRHQVWPNRRANLFIKNYLSVFSANLAAAENSEKTVQSVQSKSSETTPFDGRGDIAQTIRNQLCDLSLPPDAILVPNHPPLPSSNRSNPMPFSGRGASQRQVEAAT